MLEAQAIFYDKNRKKIDFDMTITGESKQDLLDQLNEWIPEVEKTTGSNIFIAALGEIRKARKKYKVPVLFMSWGLVEVEAEDKEDLLKKLKDPDFVNEEMPLPDDQDYVEDSYEIDFDSLDHYVGE